MAQNPAPIRPRVCLDCERPIDDLPPHFRYCRPCFSVRPESTPHEDDGQRDDDWFDGDMERMLTGVD